MNSKIKCFFYFLKLNYVGPYFLNQKKFVFQINICESKKCLRQKVRTEKVVIDQLALLFQFYSTKMERHTVFTLLYLNGEDHGILVLGIMGDETQEGGSWHSTHSKGTPCSPRVCVQCHMPTVR